MKRLKVFPCMKTRILALHIQFTLPLDSLKVVNHHEFDLWKTQSSWGVPLTWYYDKSNLSALPGLDSIKQHAFCQTIQALSISSSVFWLGHASRISEFLVEGGWGREFYCSYHQPPFPTPRHLALSEINQRVLGAALTTSHFFSPWGLSSTIILCLHILRVT